MHLSLFTDLTLRTLVFLGVQQKQDPCQIVSSTRIAEFFGCSVHHLSKVLQTMRTEGWIRAHRGKEGGFTLDRPAGEYNIGEIARKLENQGDIFGKGHIACPHVAGCPLNREFLAAREKFFVHLDQFTLEYFVDNFPR